VRGSERTTQKFEPQVVGIWSVGVGNEVMLRVGVADEESIVSRSSSGVEFRSSIGLDLSLNRSSSSSSRSPFVSSPVTLKLASDIG